MTRVRTVVVAGALVALTGCLPSDSKVQDSGRPTGPESGTVLPNVGTTGGEPATGTPTTGAATEMCARWNTDRASLTEGTWTGSVGSCDPGAISQDAIDSTVRLVNLYRWLADLDPVSDDPSRNQEAQACSLLMDANNSLSHTPPVNWACYTALGAQGAGASNIATTPAVAAVDLYMTDYGNADTLGHRRWILSNWIGPIGVGGTDSYSCLGVINGVGGAGPDWVAYPPPGPFPLEAIEGVSWGSVDEEGWSIQADGVNLAGVTVSVRHNGQDRPVTVNQLPAYYGSSQAIGFVPQGWSTEAGVYEVTVTGASIPISYQVEMVPCG